MRRKNIVARYRGQATVAVLAAVILVEVFVFIGRERPIDPRRELDALAASYSDVSGYINGHIGEVTERYGVDGAVALVMQMFNARMVEISGCHTLLHLVGHKAYDYFDGNMERLAGVDWRLCGGGYEHGIEAEIVLKSADTDIEKNLYRFCQAMRVRSTQGTPCYHGAGHSFMQISLLRDGVPDIKGSLHRCDLLIEPTPNDLTECHKGAFSEYANMIQGVDGDTGLALTTGPSVQLSVHPLAVCQSLDRKYQRSCGLQLSRVITGSDIASSLLGCSKGSYSTELKAACIESLTSIFTQQKLSRAVTMTVPEILHGFAAPLRRAYMQGALSEFRAFEQSGKPKDWAAFCASFKQSDDQTYCHELPSVY